MNCPSCAAPLQPEAQYAHLVVCPNCRSSIVLDEAATRLAGKMAVLAPAAGPLWTGASGQLKGKRFRVLGRVRYGYSGGYWDEWYLVFDDGRTAWVSEDERNFSLEVLLEETPEIPAYALIEPGASIEINGDRYHVDEKRVAVCEGGEGQLPFAVMTGERVPYLDLSSGDRFATVEFEQDEGMRVFVGRRLALDDLAVDVPRSGRDGATGEYGGDDERRQRVVRSTGRSITIRCERCSAPLTVPEEGGIAKCDACGTETDLTTRGMVCPECGAGCHARGDDAHMVVCRGCDKILDIRGVAPTAVGMIVSDQRPRLPVSIGQVLDFRGAQYFVVGHLRYMETYDYERYYADEFLLHHHERGYRWLLYEEGHYSICDELDERPERFDPRLARRKDKLSFLDRNWRVFERCESYAEVIWVDGELPWVAMVGDRVRYTDLTCPPFLLSAEWTDKEMEWYIAEYVEPAEIAEALGCAPSSLRARIGIAPHQPLQESRFARQSAVLMALCAMAFLWMAVSAWGESGRKIAEIQIPSDQYKSEYLTQSFSIDEAPGIAVVYVRSPVDNQWLYLDLALVNDRDEAVLDFSSEVSYYHGYEGGESWVEGSQKDTRVFRIDEPGNYRFLVLGQTGDAGPSRSVKLEVFEGVAIARYYIVLLIGCVVWAGLVWGRRMFFEARRWHEEDDDDE